MTPAGLRLLQDLRRTLLEPPTALRHTDTPAADEPDAVAVVA
jgi:putative transposase